ncbi:hypothetical protein GDO86_020570 [Hymenochirus boettgeri]|uniref:WW domain-containing protein n=1 Tax=Hymenochirus boettgeri TaxID=247094 RepID=A0A8T2IBG5_9PIPI|nr:hypothetical protein GDO86_020570 [Hymenochirus boettgeri]
MLCKSRRKVVGALGEEFRKEPPRERLSSEQNSSTSTLEDWETHTDQCTGQLFYHNIATGDTTWDSPFDQPEDQIHSPFSVNSLSPLPEESQWEKHFDEASRQFYFYNSVTGETSWDPPEEEMSFHGTYPFPPVDVRPPTPEADYPDTSPDEVEKYPEADYSQERKAITNPIPSDQSTVDPLSDWFCQINSEGKKFYTNSINNDTWLQSEDQSGKTYYYTPDGTLSQWSLPRVNNWIQCSCFKEPVSPKRGTKMTCI